MFLRQLKDTYQQSIQFLRSDVVVNSYEMKEVHIQFYENTAIVSAKIMSLSVNLGESKENEYRITNIWVFEEDNWKRAGFHDGKIK